MAEHNKFYTVVLAQANPGTFQFLYRNHRNELRMRQIVPQKLIWGSTEWHPTPQWLLYAWDVEKQNYRIFALADMVAAPHDWKPGDPFPGAAR